MVTGRAHPTLLTDGAANASPPDVFARLTGREQDLMQKSCDRRAGHVALLQLHLTRRVQGRSNGWILTFQLHQAGGGIRNGTTLFTMPPAQKKLMPDPIRRRKALHAVAVMLPIESKGIRRPCN